VRNESRTYDINQKQTEIKKRRLDFQAGASLCWVDLIFQTFTG
jgi:hypothetical protein